MARSRLSWLNLFSPLDNSGMTRKIHLAPRISAVLSKYFRKTLFAIRLILFHIATAFTAQLITAYSLAFAIGTPVIVFMTSRGNVKRCSFLPFIYWDVQPPSSISNIGVIPISRILLGVGTGVYLVSTFASVAEIVPTIKIGVYISMVVRI